jgi:polar amino acid transport system substrate-binding protein
MTRVREPRFGFDDPWFTHVDFSDALPLRFAISSFRHFLVSTLLILAACGSSSGALGRVIDSGVLRVGMDASFPPFEYVDGEGNLVGYDVDLAREVAARLGVVAGADDLVVDVQFVANLPYDGLYDALTAERVDVVVSALYVDESRRGTFEFTTPYFNAGHVLVVVEGAGEVAAMEDLDGRVLAVEFGSEGDVVAREYARRLSDLTILPAPTATEALSAVAIGAADAALVDRLSALAATGAGSGLRVVGDPVTDEPYAIAVWGADRRLLALLNEILNDMETDGTLDVLESRWFR